MKILTKTLMAAVVGSALLSGVAFAADDATFEIIGAGSTYMQLQPGTWGKAGGLLMKSSKGQKTGTKLFDNKLTKVSGIYNLIYADNDKVNPRFLLSTSASHAATCTLTVSGELQDPSQGQDKIYYDDAVLTPLTAGGCANYSIGITHFNEILKLVVSK